MKAIRITFAFLLTATSSIAQPYNINDLKKQLIISMHDSVKVKVLRNITVAYQNYKPDSGLYYARQVISLAQKLNDKNHQAIGFNESALCLEYLGNYTVGLKMALSSKKIAEDLYKEGKPQRLMYSYLALGILDKSNGRYGNAVANFKECIHLSQDSSLAGENFYGFYAQLGSAYLGLGKIDSALFYIKKAYALSLTATGYNKTRLPLLYTVIGNVHETMTNYGSAKTNYHLAIEKAIEFNFLFQLTRSYNDLAMLFKKQGQLDSCVYYAQKSIELSNNHHYALYATNGYKLLAQIYELRSKPDSTLKYLRLMLSQKDSVFSQSKIQQYQQLIFDEEQRKQHERDEQLENRNSIKMYSLLSGILVSLLIATILYHNNRQKIKANTLLQKQKEEIQTTLNELKIAQTQLVQREKMASLGELTAGIAHEIQNPLNFVNNFSEVSAELVEELREEREKGAKRDEGLETELLVDLHQNLQRITQNGQRASNIVKGMLEHSRTSSGERQPTNLNALCEEYLNLAYQGQRVKSTNFECILKTYFDPNLPLVSVGAQDMSRVLLNLYNNAFYAVSEKHKTAPADYQPSVWVTTQQQNGQVLVQVRDNGMGIPDGIREKIFQPFFTTKPTGEGTGLGLSLSYDIVTKGHGGELKVDTQEGEYSEFVIQLPIHPSGK